ncbi:MAG TPA: pyridoxal phosphate-dependent aminotransferase [Candidatus Sulfotelmatobacter sp.]|nr:pyridoxal phosphate-dependent aminotransferase [Candidatus Sulfotelmatobacter sp.]
MFSDRTNWKLAHNRLTAALEAARAGGGKILDLTVSNPTRAGLHYDERAILGALGSPRAIDYDPQPRGLRPAREAVAEYYRSQHGVRDFDAEKLILTTSTSEGYSYIFRLLCNPGDELLVPKPSYPLFEFLADLEDVKLVPYPLIYDHGWQMDFPSIENVVTPRTRGVVVVHPNNPTGSHVQAHEMSLLNAFCETRQLALIVDEVFLDYPHDGRPRGSFTANEGVLTFTLSGLSKVSALPQMKVAWIGVSGPQSETATALARLEVIADTYLSMNAPLQWATPALLDQRKSLQGQLLDRVRGNLAELDRQLAGQKTCERLEVEGGWYAVLRVPVTKSDEDLTIELLQKKSVLVHPGHFYDFPSDGYLVLSLITSTEEFAEGVGRILGCLSR